MEDLPIATRFIDVQRASRQLLSQAANGVRTKLRLPKGSSCIPKTTEFESLSSTSICPSSLGLPLGRWVAQTGVLRRAGIAVSKAARPAGGLYREGYEIELERQREVEQAQA